jgi:hypothetical protein
MATGDHLTRHQQGIVRRYYQHLDAMTIHKLQDLVSELYLCENDKKRAAMWDKARQALLKAGANQARVDKIIAARQIEALAQLVAELTNRK